MLFVKKMQNIPKDELVHDKGIEIWNHMDRLGRYWLSLLISWMAK